jgi:hypothetical protein
MNPRAGDRYPQFAPRWRRATAGFLTNQIQMPGWRAIFPPRAGGMLSTEAPASVGAIFLSQIAILDSLPHRRRLQRVPIPQIRSPDMGRA